MNKQKNNIKLNILLFSSTPPPIGGISSWTLNYIKKQNELGNNVDLVDIKKKNYFRIKFISEIIRTIKILIKTIKNINRNNYDIVHINTACSKNGMIRELIIISYIKRKKNIKVVLHCHCDVSKYIDNEKKHNIFIKICKKVDLLLVLNKQSYDYVLSLKQHNRVYIIENFFENKKIKKNNNINNNLKNILYVGRYIREKGCYELIDAAKENKDLNFYFIGDSDNKFNASLLNESSNIYNLGVKLPQEVYEYMSKFDALILPSYAEGFPMVILEAMFIGIPIITTKVGSIWEMLGNDGAIYIEVGNVDSINEALIKIQSKDIREKISNRNIKYSNNNYSSDIVVRRINEIYMKE